jgi:hypothetical protein
MAQLGLVVELIVSGFYQTINKIHVEGEPMCSPLR